MEPLTTAALISGGIAAAGSAANIGVQSGNTAKGREQAERFFNKQFDFAKQQYEYQQYMAENAYQVAVNDAKSAGLSPLAVTSGASAPSGVSIPTPDSSLFDYGTGEDVNTFIDTLRAYADTFARSSEESGRNKRNTEDINADWDKLNLQISSASATLEKQQEFEAANFLKQQRFSTELENNRQAAEFRKQQQDSLSELTAGSFHNYRSYEDYGEYQTALDKWLTAAVSCFEEYGNKNDMQSVSTSTSSSSSDSSGYNGSLGVSVLGSAGIGHNSSTSESDSSSNSSMTARGSNNKVLLGKALNSLNVPYPLFSPRIKISD